MLKKALIKPYLRPLSPIPTRVKPKGRLRIPVKCLMCDLYGTLFISGSGDIGAVSSFEPWQNDALERLLTRHKQKSTAAKLQERLTHAIQDQHMLAREKGISHPEVIIEAVWQQLLPNESPENVRRLAVEFEMITNPVWPMPGLEALLSVCRSSGIRLGVISNAQFYTPYLFSWLLGHTPENLGFDHLLTIYSYQIGEAKPSATLFDMACQRLKKIGIMPSEVAYIGNDMGKDIVPAHQAGFQSILFAGDQRSLRFREKEPVCQTIEPDMIVTHLEQLTSFIQKVPLTA